ncbi:ribonuclease HII [Xylocopilactobacillus apis]|uniref:Ribonuclease HII n=1 Tax=Xylocopilactobacillus apis TaxID=2932183 RepID=A0AAU9CVV0_9LACO|nr:ribonuclease HII [Xylocopilactobacillus apis]
MHELKKDSRKSVQVLLKSYERKCELIRIKKLEYEQKSTFEAKFWSQNKIVAGVDEVGRGCLAGPVVCGAVVLDSRHPILGIDDSKKLSVRERERLSEEIKKYAICYSVAIISPKKIDQINILEASRLGMLQAVNKLKITPQELLIDAIHINSSIPQTDIVKGDARSVSIGAASIIAKVYRDALMTKYDSFYPEYNFKKNKGYGTKDHLSALEKYGITPIHRQSFSPVQKFNA